MYLLFSIKLVFHIWCKDAVVVGNGVWPYPFCVGDRVTWYSTSLLFLIPVESVVLVLGGSPYAVEFWMVVGSLLGPLMWIYIANRGFMYAVQIVGDDGINISIVVFNLPFYCAFVPDLYQSSISLYWSIFYRYEWSNNVIDVVGHAGWGMVIHPNYKVSVL